MTAAAPPRVLTIDVAHPPMSSAEAEDALDALLREAASGGGVALIRVIHGFGSRGKGGVLRTTVRNWAYRRRGKIATVIPGEDYSSLLPEVGEMLTGRGISIGEVGPAGPGVTLLLLA